MELTLKQAKELALEIWHYFEEHGEAQCKEDLPLEIYSRVKDYQAECPLCTLFDTARNSDCVGCPLTYTSGETCYNATHPFRLWNVSRVRYPSETARKVRTKAAKEIVRLLEAWEV